MSLIIASPDQLRSNQGMLACPYCSCRFMAGSAEDASEEVLEDTPEYEQEYSQEHTPEEPVENLTETQTDAPDADLETVLRENVELEESDNFQVDFSSPNESANFTPPSFDSSGFDSPGFEPATYETTSESENTLGDDETPDSLLYTPTNTTFTPLNIEHNDDNSDSDSGTGGHAVSLEEIRANIAARSAELGADDDLEYLNQHKSPNFLQATLWGVACLILILALPIQYGYFMRDDLAKHAPLRPLIKSMCQTLGCEISLQRDISQIKIIGRDVRSHPDFVNALLIYVTLNNQATFYQAYPALELSFSDINGRPLAKRKFSPLEYLPSDINLKQGMAPNTPLRGKLEINDPGNNAVNFQFEFF